MKKLIIDINDNPTNGDVIMAILNPYKICKYECSIHIYITEEDFWKADYQINCSTSWWNAPYQKGKEMKNETARREIESLDYYLQNHTDDYSEESHTAMVMAMDALNNAVLDKIRAELEALITINSTSDYSNGVMNCLNVIDKYKVESEEV